MIIKTTDPPRTYLYRLAVPQQPIKLRHQPRHLRPHPLVVVVSTITGQGQRLLPERRGNGVDDRGMRNGDPPPPRRQMVTERPGPRLDVEPAQRGPPLRPRLEQGEERCRDGQVVAAVLRAGRQPRAVSRVPRRQGLLVGPRALGQAPRGVIAERRGVVAPIRVGRGGTPCLGHTPEHIEAAGLAHRFLEPRMPALVVVDGLGGVFGVGAGPAEEVAELVRELKGVLGPVRTIYAQIDLPVALRVLFVQGDGAPLGPHHDGRHVMRDACQQRGGHGLEHRAHVVGRGVPFVGVSQQDTRGRVCHWRGLLRGRHVYVWGRVLARNQVVIVAFGYSEAVICS